MRKILLLLAAAAIAAVPVIADAKAKKDTNPNEPGRRLVVNGFKSFVLPFAQTTPPAKKAMHRKHHKHHPHMKAGKKSSKKK